MPADWQIWCCGSVVMSFPYGWHTIPYCCKQLGGEAQVHLMPHGDLKIHTGHGCWCEPDLDVDSGIYEHHSLDQRELYEQGLRLTH